MSVTAIVFFAFAGAVFVDCTHSPAVSPPDVMVPPVDGAVLVPATDDCSASCNEWRKRGCPEGNPTAGGLTCEDVCRNAADAGVDTAKQLSCASSAPNDCASLRACPY